VVKKAAVPPAFASRHSTAAVCHAFMNPWSTSVVSTGTHAVSSRIIRSSLFANNRWANSGDMPMLNAVKI